MTQPSKLGLTNLVIFLHFVVPMLSSSIFRKILSAPLTKMPCDLSDSPNTIFMGDATLTDNTGYTTSEASLGGWVFPRGFDPGTFYTIFSFHDKVNILIYSISYQSSTYTLRSNFAGVTITNYFVPEFTTSEWFYIMSFIDFDISNSNLEAGTQIYRTNSNLILNDFQQSTLIRSADFNKNFLIFNIGYSQNSYSSPIQPSCALTKYVYAYSSNAISNIAELLFDVQALGTHLLHNFDDFYTPINQSKLLSTSGFSENALHIPSYSTDPFLLSTSATTTSPSFSTDYINASQNAGFTMQFYIKTTSSSPSYIRVLTIIKDLAFIDFLDSPSPGKIELGGLVNIPSVNFSTWLEIIVIMKFGISNVLHVSERTYHTDLVKIFIPQSYQRTLRVTFGSLFNSESFRLRNVRIYSGVYITQEPSANCFYSMNNGADSQCLVCNSGYLLNLQQYDPMCDYPSGGSGITPEATCQYLENWIPLRTACPHSSMVHDRPSSTICRCRKQQYFNGTQCVPCPRYCPECVSSSGVCLNSVPSRTGDTCPILYFDDGYYCKKKDQFISQLPYTITILNPGTIQKTFGNGQLNLEGRSSFLISFSFQPILAKITSKSTIAFVKLGTSEYITVVLNQPVLGSLTISLYIDQVLQDTRSVHPYQTTWYSLYSDLSQTVLHFHTNGHLNYMKANNPPKSMFQVSICVGTCSASFLVQPYPQTGQINQRPVRYIKGSKNPLLYPENELLLLLCDEANELAFFKLGLQLYPDSHLGEYPSSTVLGQKIDFGTTSVILTEQLKGFGFFNNQTIATVDIGKNNVPFSFSTSIFIETIHTQTTLLSYVFDTRSDLVIEYYLVPQEVDSSVTIRICVGIECQDTIEPATKLYMNEPNFLAILTQDLSLFSVDYMKIAFKIYCNYVTETITFYLDRPSHSFTVISNQIVSIGKQSEKTGEFLYFLNRIQFVEGNTFHYEDRNDANSCYLSLDSPLGTSPQCLLPKKNYVLGVGTPILISTCENPFSSSISFVNIYTRECISSKQLRSQCFDVNKNLNTCKECQPNYYLEYIGDQNTLQTVCKPCSAQCATCIGDSTFCLICTDQSLSLPDCLCQEPGYYLDSKSQCMKCDDRCETCSGTATNCLTCSSSRILPPSCPCDASSYEVFPAASLIHQCAPYPCNNKCSSCTNSPSNCLTCSQNRQNPPTCSCIPGTILSATGTCETCPKRTFYDSISNACVPCAGLCEDCSINATTCTVCIAGLYLQNGMCVCSGNQPVIIQSFNLQAYCAGEMDVTFSLQIRGRNQYVFVFTFPYELHAIDFTSNPLDRLFDLYIDEVPMSMYKLSNPVISKNELRVDLIGTTSFRAKSGRIVFLVNQVFLNKQEDHVLNRKYISHPFTFDSIGPFVFSEETDSWNSMFDFGDIKPGNQSFLATIQGLQLVSYFLNTMQPTVLYLLLPISFPPNLYGFLQKLGLVIYPDIQGFQGTPNAQGYQFYDFEGDQSVSNSDPLPIQRGSSSRILNEINEQANNSRVSNELAFKRLGFSNSALISMPLICLKYVVLLVVLFFNELMLQKARTSETWVKAKSFLIGQLLTEGEVNLLIVSVAVLIQLSNIDQFDWTSRYGFYLSCVIVCVNLFCITKLVRELVLFSRSQTTNQIKLSRMESVREQEKNSKLEVKAFASDSYSTQGDVEEELKQQNYTRNTVYWETLTSRIKKKRIAESNSYFLLQLFKKLLLILVIFYLRNFPKAICVICGMIYFVSSLTTVQMKPYLYVRSRYFKIITDIMFSAIWVLHYWIVDIDAQMIDDSHQKQAMSELNRDDVQLYFTLGEVVIILLMILNIGYAIESVCCLIDSLKEYLKNRKEQKEKEMKSNGLLKTKRFTEGQL